MKINKKILVSLSVIGVVAAVAIGGTIAYFSNTETSAGNIFVAGAIDLKIDHTKQTYNDVDCKTCSVSIQSDTSNIVVSTVGGADPVSMPHAAVLVSQPYNERWLTTIDGVSWIWATDPTLPADTTHDVIYTFQRNFEWWGPITGATLQLNVGADNSYEVYLNGHWVGGENTEVNYQGVPAVYSDTEISPYILQGDNTLEIEVKNWEPDGFEGNPSTNPGGLLYKFVIDGQCDNDYFRNNCQLWGLKDLENEKFFNFNDVKPGDRGINVISLHNYNNDGWVCMSVTERVDNENAINQSEQVAGDTSEEVGELSNYLKLFVWRDENGNGIYEPATENPIGSYVLDTINMIPIYDSTTGTGALIGSTTESLGLAWCFGNQTVEGDGTITCDGSGADINGYNMAQTDSFLASLVFYTEQSRNNGSFVCGQAR
jgi:predicted ribosomally synthesized peptide with SipW-like signal peptide